MFKKLGGNSSRMGAGYYFVLTSSWERTCICPTVLVLVIKKRTCWCDVQCTLFSLKRHVELLSLINVISKSLVNLTVLILSIVVFHSFLSSYWTKMTKPCITIHIGAVSSKRGTENHMQKSLESTKMLHFAPE